MTYPKTAFASVAASLAVALVSSSAHAAVVINELFKGASGAGEFVELYNNGAEAVDISGWTLQAGTNATTSVRGTVPGAVGSETTMLGPDEYFVFSKTQNADAGADAGTTGALLTGNLPAASSTSDIIVLKNEATSIDTVIWGSPNSESLVDDTGEVASSLAPKPVNGRSMGRIPNGVDQNMSATEFRLFAAGQETPGATNYTPPVPDAGTSSSGSSSGGSSSGSSSGKSSSSSSSGGKSSSSSSGSGSGGNASSGGKNPEGDDDDDNSNLAADEGGCNVGTATPGTFLLGLAALFVMRRRRR